MTPELTALIERLNQELNQIEQQATKCSSLLRKLLDRFSDNAILLEQYAFLNATLLFVDNSRRQVSAVERDTLSATFSPELIQEIGEELGTTLGQILEIKSRVGRINKLLELG